MCADWLHPACAPTDALKSSSASAPIVCAHCALGSQRRVGASATVTARDIETILSSIKPIDVGVPLHAVADRDLPNGNFFKAPRLVASVQQRTAARLALDAALKCNSAFHVPSMDYTSAARDLAEAVSAHHHIEHIPLLSPDDSAILAEHRRHAAIGDYLIVTAVDNGAGYSVKALVEIDTRTLIGEYTGAAIPASRAEQIESQYQFVLTNTGVAAHSVVLDAARACSVVALVDGAAVKKRANATMQVVNDAGKLRLALVAKERIFAGQLIVYDYGELFALLAKTFVDRCPSSDPRSIQSYLGTAASLRYFGPPACRWHLTREQLRKRSADAIDVSELADVARFMQTKLERMDNDGAIGTGCRTLVDIERGARLAFLSGEWSDVRTPMNASGVYEIAQAFKELDVTRYLNVTRHLDRNAFVLANHDCTRANARIECLVVDSLVVFFAFATRKIRAGEPISYDYRGGDAHVDLPFTCLCLSCLLANLVELLERPFPLRPAYEFFPLVVRASKLPDGGKGLFARSAIPKGAPIGEYVGKRLRGDAVIKEHEKSLPPDSRCYLVKFMHANKWHAIDFDPNDKSHGQVGFVNHSSVRPNAELHVVVTNNGRAAESEPRIVMFALEDISADAELLLNYGENRPSVIKANPWLRPQSEPAAAARTTTTTTTNVLNTPSFIEWS